MGLHTGSVGTEAAIGRGFGAECAGSRGGWRCELPWGTADDMPAMAGSIARGPLGGRTMFEPLVTAVVTTPDWETKTLLSLLWIREAFESSTGLRRDMSSGLRRLRESKEVAERAGDLSRERG